MLTIMRMHVCTLDLSSSAILCHSCLRICRARLWSPYRTKVHYVTEMKITEQREKVPNLNSMINFHTIWTGNCMHARKPMFNFLWSHSWSDCTFSKVIFAYFVKSHVCSERIQPVPIKRTPLLTQSWKLYRKFDSKKKKVIFNTLAYCWLPY